MKTKITLLVFLLIAALFAGCSLEYSGVTGAQAADSGNSAAGTRLVSGDSSYLSPNFIRWGVSDQNRYRTFYIKNYNPNHYYSFRWDRTYLTYVGGGTSSITLRIADAIKPRTSDPSDNVDTFLKYYVFNTKDWSQTPNLHDFGNNIHLC